MILYRHFEIALGKIGMRPGTASLVVVCKIGYGKMALAINWIINIKIFQAGDHAVTLDDHEVASASAPANSRSDGSSGIDFILYILKAGLAHYACKIMGTRQRPVEKPGHVACGWHGTIATIAQAELAVRHATLCPCAPEPIKMRDACCRRSPAPVGLGLHLHGESQLFR